MNNTKYEIRNLIVSKLAELGLILHWDGEEPETGSWLQLSWGLGRLELENVVDGLSKLKHLFGEVNTKLISQTSKKINFEWNYLGSTVDRENYLNLLNEFFWQNQNEQVIIGHKHYLTWLEEPWRLVNSATEIGLDLPLATSQFSLKSLDFFENLEKNLVNSIFQPYLIVSAEASFQWSFTFDGKTILSGVIIPNQSVAFLEIYLT